MENEYDDRGILNDGSHWVALYVDYDHNCFYFDVEDPYRIVSDLVNASDLVNGINLVNNLELDRNMCLMCMLYIGEFFKLIFLGVL
jgi:hypothetical protein